MSRRTSAARYARALLDVTTKGGDPDQAGTDLAAFGALVAGHPDLQRVLTNPVVPVQAQRQVVNELTTRMKISLPVQKLLLMLADRSRLRLLPDLVEVYRERLMDHKQIVRAEITTAAPLADDRVAHLRQRLSAATGREVLMTTKVDPALIAGIVARMGSTVYDGSVATQLSKLRDKLLQS